MTAMESTGTEPPTPHFPRNKSSRVSEPQHRNPGTFKVNLGGLTATGGSLSYRGILLAAV